ncbi:hypothetical protein KBK19_06830 [Microvirga sp. STR05]|uniref:Uncharacterized protein n=1 Tax=Hymenobacter duratus TaxID=2771356 RepID=A0ABR8JD40_9BACT|nr:hypothetical protein [Hymenobacter duratus]MBD2714742.1 hypothetical protein [Hymenobacter duratus]MBR7949647.1 hypothetical protein [Microvirga sp. STR05]
MQISPSDQEHADIDYFATDTEGHILHVASGGGVLPASVAASEEALLELHQYFLTLPESTAADLVTGLPTGLNYESFIRYARRGLFSFDKTNLHNHQDPHYYLMARPQHPLTVAELPPHIAKLLRRTQLPGMVAQLTTLDASTVL